MHALDAGSPLISRSSAKSGRSLTDSVTSGQTGNWGRPHAAHDVVVIPASFGEAFYYEARWIEKSGDDEKTMIAPFLRYALPGQLPRISIKPEELFGLANNDINMEWQAFNKEFDVKAEDEQAAHALLTGPMQEFLMARMRGLHVEFSGNEAFIALGDYNP